MPTIEQLMDVMEPEMRGAFLSAVDDMKSSTQMSALTSAVQAGDFDRVAEVLNLRPEFFASLDDTIWASYLEGGRSTLSGLSPIRVADGTSLVVRFGGRSARAERFISSYSSRKIISILDDQREAVRTVLRAGIEFGDNPRTTALGLVGRVNRVTGRREGGVVGLTSQQSKFVTSMRAELLSGDPDLMRNYFSRSRRDKRLDSIVRRAIDENRAVRAVDVDRISAKYSDRLLKLRGDTIARTETLTSLHAGQEEGLRQLVDAGHIRPEQIRQVWRATNDSRTRDSHRDLDGASVGFNEVFNNGVRFPGDPFGPAEEVINCRCWLEPRIDYLTNIRGNI